MAAAARAQDGRIVTAVNAYQPWATATAGLFPRAAGAARSRTNEPAPTGRRRTARSNASPHPARRVGVRPPGGWLHTYNHHRGHTALKGQPPASRVPNLSGQYN
ncbi:hypothetical protein GCM10017771_71640 [Streptomyces capitiformicae]|uniref:Transposase n=1 Tax=Streptomyces capitiformicae TaxID=2014920 RepID=A0A918ZF86_9ACTN|nr:hypothetical protein GCM10017771_71640 [Streptomyces capitiformicae]